MFHGKLIYKNVKGGVKLVETDYTIKSEKIINSIRQLKSLNQFDTI